MSPTVTALEMLVRLLVAIALGGLIGYERELRDQPAGLRTHLLVALASAAFTLISLQAAFHQNWDAETGGRVLQFESGRIASNVVVGIGFLGGGAILHAGATVKGLTTAASLWMCAAVGMASGAGMPFLAILSTSLCLFALVVLKHTFERSRNGIVRISVRIDLQGAFISRADLLEFLKPVGGQISGTEYVRDLTDNQSRMVIDVSLSNGGLEEPLMRRIEELPGLKRLEVTRSG